MLFALKWWFLLEHFYTAENFLHFSFTCAGAFKHKLLSTCLAFSSARNNNSSSIRSKKTVPLQFLTGICQACIDVVPDAILCVCVLVFLFLFPFLFLIFALHFSLTSNATTPYRQTYIYKCTCIFVFTHCRSTICSCWLYSTFFRHIMYINF